MEQDGSSLILRSRHYGKNLPSLLTHDTESIEEETETEGTAHVTQKSPLEAALVTVWHLASVFTPITPLGDRMRTSVPGGILISDIV